MPKIRRPLSPEDEDWIAGEIWRLLPVLKNPRRRWWGRRLVRELLWFWTADAVNDRDVIQRDAVKYDPRYLHHTDAALDAAEHGEKSELEHEHAAEIAELLDILENDRFTTASDVRDLLVHLNIAVLVTATEHRSLSPVPWPNEWRVRQPLARYSRITVRPPSDPEWRKAHARRPASPQR
jgi:hypothetical protein